MMKEIFNGLVALPLGGVGEIGMNLMVYACDGRLLVVDAGIGFPDATFAPGVEVMVPDITWLREHQDRIDGIVITHAHEDHIGGLAYLWEDMRAPVYLSKFSKLVLEYKLAEVGLEKEVPVHEVQVGKSFDIGPFNIEMAELTHSIPESNALMIKTPYGQVVHTGDYKLDPTPVIGKPSNLARLKKAGDEGVLAMLSDSTNVFLEEHSGSEQTVFDNLQKLVDKQQNRVYLCTFSSNVSRLKSAMEVAINSGRKIACWGRSMQRMMHIAKTCGYIPADYFKHVIDAENAVKLPKNEVFIMLTGSQGESRAALARLSQGGLRLPLEEDDTIILSSKIIPGNERPILDMINRLVAKGADVIHEWVNPVHVSGHAGIPEMKEVYAAVRPQIAVPVHGEPQHLREHAKLAKSIGVPEQKIISNGMALHLAPEKPHIITADIPAGRWYIDGWNILDEDRFILTERRRMASEGVVVVTATVDKRGKLLKKPVVKTCGLIDESLQPELIESAQKAAHRALSDRKGKDLNYDEKGRENMRIAVQRSFKDSRGKRPMVIAQIIGV